MDMTLATEPTLAESSVLSVVVVVDDVTATAVSVAFLSTCCWDAIQEIFLKIKFIAVVTSPKRLRVG